jgi:hypothetical protein
VCMTGGGMTVRVPHYGAGLAVPGRSQLILPVVCSGVR